MAKAGNKPSVLFVCTANVCRSVMAAALFRARLEQSGIDPRSWRIDSAGTWASFGAQAADGARVVMRRRGLDISAHRSKPAAPELVKRFALVLTMERGQKEALQIENPARAGQIFMLSEMCGSAMEIEDPMGGNVEAMERIAAELDRYLSRGLDRIREMQSFYSAG